MARKQDAYYFDNFIACAEESCHAASLLRKVLGDFKPQELEKYLEEIHEIENRADGKKHEMLDRLAREFIPPIEREDIVELSQHIDTGNRQSRGCAAADLYGKCSGDRAGCPWR